MACLSVAYWIRFKTSSWPSRPPHSWVALDMLCFLPNTFCASLDMLYFLPNTFYASSWACFPTAPYSCFHNPHPPLWFAHLLFCIWEAFFLFFTFSEVQLDLSFWNFQAGWLAALFPLVFPSCWVPSLC